MSTAMNSNIADHNDTVDYVFIDDGLEYKYIHDSVETYHKLCYEPLTGDDFIFL